MQGHFCILVFFFCWVVEWLHIKQLQKVVKLQMYFNCVCAVTKIFTKFLPANNFCQRLRSHQNFYKIFTRRSWQKLFAGKNFVKILVTRKHSCTLRVTRKRSCTFGMINRGHLKLATSPIDLSSKFTFEFITWIQMCERNCVCAVTKIFTKFLPANNFANFCG